MKYYHVPFLLNCLIIFSCNEPKLKSKSQFDNNVQDSVKVSTLDIVDPIEPMPYEIKRNSVFIDLPDSLGQNSLDGHAVLEVIIDENSEILECNIKKLQLLEKGTRIKRVDYQFGVKESDSIIKNRYDKFFINYVKGLRISKLGDPQKENQLNLIVRFK